MMMMMMMTMKAMTTSVEPSLLLGIIAMLLREIASRCIAIYLASLTSTAVRFFSLSQQILSLSHSLSLSLFSRFVVCAKRLQVYRYKEVY